VVADNRDDSETWPGDLAQSSAGTKSLSDSVITVTNQTFRDCVAMTGNREIAR
jgi:hypothetical protein